MANFLGIVGKVRKVLGKITDLLLQGRQAGLWSEKPGVNTGVGNKPHDPTMPDLKGYR